jgi:hypothetical protein
MSSTTEEIEEEPLHQNKKQKSFDPSRDKYVYLVTADSDYIYMKECLVDEFAEIYEGRNRQVVLFDRVFKTPGLTLHVTNLDFTIKGSVIGPLDEESIKIFHACAKHMATYCDWKFSPTPDDYEIDPNLPNNIKLTLERSQITHLKIE